MSYYLINPSGRTVAVETLKEYEGWLNMQGFRKATEAEEKDFISKRIDWVKKMGAAKVDANGIYFATVSQGGKDGYAIASANIIKELKKLGYSVSTHYDNQKICILFHNPYSILRIEAPYKILFTMFESTKIPDDWLDYLRAADLVIVPSKFCQTAFKQSGIDTKVVPLGYDPEVYKFIERENKREMKKDFTFLHYNAFNLRKGFVETFKAFVKEFRKDEPVKMIFKTTLDNPPIPIRKEEYPNIEVITGKLPEKELNDLLYRSDCFVFPSRGEGFGLPPIEAMATGLPVIIPNASGMSEYFNPEYMYEVKIKEECPAIYERYKGIDVGKMFVSDVDDLASKMRWAYEHEKEAKETGKKASEYVKQYTFANTALVLKGIIDPLLISELKVKKPINVLPLEVA